MPSLNVKKSDALTFSLPVIILKVSIKFPLNLLFSFQSSYVDNMIQTIHQLSGSSRHMLKKSKNIFHQKWGPCVNTVLPMWSNKALIENSEVFSFNFLEIPFD